MRKLGMVLLLSLCLVACSPQNKESAITSIDDNLYLTDIVSDVVNNYDSYKDFAIKHGMIYTNGVSTNKSPVMEEIDGYVYGVDDVEEDELVYEYYDYDILPLRETDYTKIYEEFKPMTIDEVLEYVDANCYWYDMWEPEGYDEEESNDGDGYMDMGIEPWYEYYICLVGYHGRTSDVDHTKENGYITMEDWENMSDDDKKIHLSKVMVHFNEKANEFIEVLNADSEKKNGTVRSVSRATDDNSPEYQTWCLENKDIIEKAQFIDFTVEKDIPSYVTVEDGEYFVTLEDLKTLWESQGSPEDSVLSMCVYGFNFDYDVSNYNFK